MRTAWRACSFCDSRTDNRTNARRHPSHPDRPRSLSAPSTAGFSPGAGRRSESSSTTGTWGCTRPGGCGSGIWWTWEMRRGWPGFLDLTAASRNESRAYGRPTRSEGRAPAPGLKGSRTRAVLGSVTSLWTVTNLWIGYALVVVPDGGCEHSAGSALASTPAATRVWGPANLAAHIRSHDRYSSEQESTSIVDRAMGEETSERPRNGSAVRQNPRGRGTRAHLQGPQGASAHQE